MAVISVRKIIRAGVAVGLLNAGAAMAALDCSVNSLSTVIAEDTRIVSADIVTHPVNYCRIEGAVTTRDPGPNQVGFLLALPETGWNGRFFFNSVGGSAGLLQTPPAQLLVDGFAVATTDGGHRSTSILDWSKLDDPAVALDLSKRSMHVSAVAAQTITKAWYDADSMYRYVQGCSGGGQRAIAAARNYPEDYDGFIVEAPGINAANILAFASATQHMMKNPDGWVSPAEIMLVEQTVNEVCGAIEGVVTNSRTCDFDPAILQCQGSQKEGCLTGAQIETLELINRGPRGPAGQAYPGAPWTNTTGWIGFFTGHTPPANWSETEMGATPGGYVIAHSFMRGYFGNDYNFVEEFDFNNQDHIDAYLAADREAGMGQTDADLSGVEKAGGKVIFWHGMSDHGIVYEDMIRYYEELKETLPGEDRVNAFARMFAVPGVLHCRGGTGPSDMRDRTLDKMIDWVEKDIAPRAIVANRTVEPGAQVRQFLICPYPQVAEYIPKKLDKGDPMALLRGNPAFDANNWACRSASGENQ
jgi:feruloyl esterase